jgi:hypothetical protein
VQSAAHILGTIATHVTRTADCDVLIVNTRVGDNPSRQV